MNSTHRHHRKKTSPITVILILLGFILFVALVAGASAWYLWNRSTVLNKEEMFVPTQKIDIGEPTPALTPEPPEVKEASSAPDEYDMYYDGAFYKLREDVVAVLFMGVDSRKNEASESDIVSGTNQADTILLGVFDTGAGTVRVLQLPRDTEADVKVLDMTKTYVSTERMHLCLQHAYGDGGELSCQLMMDAVSNLLFGAPLYRYVSLGTDGVQRAVNAVGGVEITMMDDFSFYSAAMKKGATVKLNGKRALAYIQSRQNKGLDGTDTSRQARQIQFLKAFIETVKTQSKSNPAIVLTVYDAAKDSMQTNLSLEELLFLANQGLEAGLNDENLLQLPGTVGTEEQPLFHMDDEAARALMLDLFYEEVKK